MKTDMLCENFKTSTAQNDVEMTGDGQDSGEPSRDDDDFENQLCTSRMTTSVRKTSLTIGMGNCQGTLM